MKQPPPGKKSEPTREELEFICRHLDDCSNEGVLDMMQDTTFPLRSVGFIKRRRKEWDVAKKVLQIKLEKEIDPIVVQQKREHFAHLADIAAELVSGLGTLQEKGDPSDPSKYKIWDIEAPSEMTKQQLISQLECYVEMTVQQPNGHFNLSLLASHLKEEPDMSKGLDQAIQDSPVKVVETLQILARRKTFKGTCVVCKDW